MSQYLMHGQLSELERLQLQSRMWEPAGRRLLAELGDGRGARVLDAGCGCLGWLRALSEWVGPDGEVVGTDIDDRMLDAARRLVDDERLSNVRIERDDLFASALDPGSFDLVHARFQLAPIGRADEQLAFLRTVVAPGGRIVLEDPDSSTWHCNPPAPAVDRLTSLVLDAFRQAGGDFDAGRTNADLLRSAGLEPEVRAEVLALPPGHPYLRLPLQFSVSLEPRILAAVDADALAELRAAAEAELADPARWGTTFTLIQTWAAA